MSISRRALCALAAGWAGSGSAAMAAASAQAGDVLVLSRWIAASGDHRSQPFCIVDKRAARAFVFADDLSLVAATPVLLGVARGDHSVPGVGDLAPADIPMADRTTPAGRFVSRPGKNLNGEDVVWFDHGAGLAIHRLRANAAHASRLQRLDGGRPETRRVSAGCVVVPVAFYERVVAPTLGRGRGVLYVLPEVRALQDVFPGLQDD
jgi:hypothetical protein